MTVLTVLSFDSYGQCKVMTALIVLKFSFTEETTQFLQKKILADLVSVTFPKKLEDLVKSLWPSFRKPQPKLGIDLCIYCNKFWVFLDP